MYHNHTNRFIQLLYIMYDNEEKYLIRLGNNISRIRKLKGLSQLDVCATISMDKPNLSSIENGRQNPTTLTQKKIADAIDVEVKDFFTFKD